MREKNHKSPVNVSNCFGSVGLRGSLVEAYS